MNKDLCGSPFWTITLISYGPKWTITDEETGERRGGIDLRNPETGEVVLNEETGLSENVYGAHTCGTPIGSGTFERSWLAAKVEEICSSIYKTTNRFHFIPLRLLIR
jgi:hypothetical protein